MGAQDPCFAGDALVGAQSCLAGCYLGMNGAWICLCQHLHRQNGCPLLSWGNMSPHRTLPQAGGGDMGLRVLPWSWGHARLRLPGCLPGPVLRAHGLSFQSNAG